MEDVLHAERPGLDWEKCSKQGASSYMTDYDRTTNTGTCGTYRDHSRFKRWSAPRGARRVTPRELGEPCGGVLDGLLAEQG
jgi:hypothetical protein